MLKVGIKLYGVEEVKKFVNTISQYEFDFDLTSGRYIIDAKSMIGIFSLDLKTISHLLFTAMIKRCLMRFSESLMNLS